MEFKNCFDNIVKEFSTGKYGTQIQKAKQEFFSLSGTVYEDSREYIDRINLFLDWYVFDRNLDEEDLTPLKMYIFMHDKNIDEEQKGLLQGMDTSVSSLFIVKELRRDSVKVKDMFTGIKYEVHDDYFLSFVHKGDIFQGRIINIGKKKIFGVGFCFHYPEAESYIKGEIKKIRNMERSYHLDLMMRLALMKVKTVEYPHVDVRDIYSTKPLVRF
jgi:hypothetical protein